MHTPSDRWGEKFHQTVSSQSFLIYPGKVTTFWHTSRLHTHWWEYFGPPCGAMFLSLLNTAALASHPCISLKTLSPGNSNKCVAFPHVKKTCQIPTRMQPKIIKSHGNVGDALASFGRKRRAIRRKRRTDSDAIHFQARTWTQQSRECPVSLLVLWGIQS